MLAHRLSSNSHTFSLWSDVTRSSVLMSVALVFTGGAEDGVTLVPHCFYLYEDLSHPQINTHGPLRLPGVPGRQPDCANRQRRQASPNRTGMRFGPGGWGLREQQARRR